MFLLTCFRKQFFQKTWRKCINFALFYSPLFCPSSTVGPYPTSLKYLVDKLRRGVFLFPFIFTEITGLQMMWQVGRGEGDGVDGGC